MKYGSTTSGGIICGRGRGKYISAKRSPSRTWRPSIIGQEGTLPESSYVARESPKNDGISPHPTLLKVPSRNIADDVCRQPDGCSTGCTTRRREVQWLGYVVDLAAGNTRRLRDTPKPPPPRLPPPTSTVRRCTNSHLPGYLCTAYRVRNCGSLYRPPRDPRSGVRMTPVGAIGASECFVCSCRNTQHSTVVSPSSPPFFVSNSLC